MIKWLKGLHYLGSLLLFAGSYLLIFTESSQRAQGMLMVASLIGLGLTMMTPYPVALVIEWAKKQDTALAKPPSVESDKAEAPKSENSPSDKPQEKE
ncbi:hypothetical protein ACRWQN_05680 [Shewanella sp. HL-SH8]|uniref:hypothetical protein n=1 Tax=unclassified Shewanella TaxID=196818 RepID=UPI003EB698B1